VTHTREEKRNIAASVREIAPAPPANLGAQWKLCAALLAAWLTVLAFILPYDPDEAIYKIIATGIVHGKWPYHDLFDHKPPLIYLWYLPTALGAGIEFERVLAALLAAATVPVVALLARRWLSGRQTSLAVIAYALLMANPAMLGTANTEAFLLLPLLASFAVGSPLLAGVLLGIAVMTKPVAVVLAPVLVLLWRKDTWRVAIGGFLVCLVVSLPFLPIWRDYWEANVSFNLRYGRNLGYGNGILPLLALNPGVLIGALPLWYSALAGAFRQRNRLIWLWAACGVVSVKVTGLDWGHAYALLAPPAALFAGIGLESILQRRIATVMLGVMTAAVVALIIVALPWSGARPPQAMLDTIHTAKGEVYVLGDKTQLYAYADRQPERRFFVSGHLVARRDWGEAMRQQLIACPPDLLVVPKRNVFPVDWEDDVTAGYEQRTEYDAAVLFTQPRVPCGAGDSLR
jgi:4-amino-4-deoxy-L-arabinose transferase-like glycosyltransferase